MIPDDAHPTPQMLAKRPRTAAAGSYGHPVHPILVTVPIGAWLTSFALDIGSRIVHQGAELTRAARWVILIGCIGALLAALTGVLDLSALPRDTRAFKVGLTHMAINVGVLVLFIVSLVFRSDYATFRVTSISLIVLSAVALALFSVSGWLGGMLSYRFGVRVVDEETQHEGFTS